MEKICVKFCFLMNGVVFSVIVGNIKEESSIENKVNLNWIENEIVWKRKWEWF